MARKTMNSWNNVVRVKWTQIVESFLHLGWLNDLLTISKHMGGKSPITYTGQIAKLLKNHIGRIQKIQPLLRFGKFWDVIVTITTIFEGHYMNFGLWTKNGFHPSCFWNGKRIIPWGYSRDFRTYCTNFFIWSNPWNLTLITFSPNISA